MWGGKREEGGSESAGKKKEGGWQAGEKGAREKRQKWGWCGEPGVSQPITRQRLSTPLVRAGCLRM